MALIFLPKPFTFSICFDTVQSEPGNENTAINSSPSHIFHDTFIENMTPHIVIPAKELRQKIKLKEICFGGNRKLKIYGTLHCSSGKRMNTSNRVFFKFEAEAIENNFRPCGHCMKAEYKKWKNGLK